MPLQTVPAAAVGQYRATQGFKRDAVRNVRRAWAEVDPRFLSESWREQLPLAALAVADVQLDAAEAGARYSAAALAQRGQYEPPAAFVDAGAFVGVMPDGGDLEAALYMAAPRAKALIGQGAPPALALRHARDRLDVMVGAVVSDTGRAAASVDVASRQGIGYTRMLNPPSCSRCAILAGRWYRWNAGFDRHPRCFPAGVVVSGPAAEAASRRWYEGELVVLTTASGVNLPITGNHPVLTGRGWVPAHLIEEGDDVVRSTSSKGSDPLVVQDQHQVPALIEDVWRALGVDGLSTRVVGSPDDFHGDGNEGEVDVVYADGALCDRRDPAFAEQPRDERLPLRFVEPSGFLLERLAGLLSLPDRATTSSSVGREHLELPLLGTHAPIPDLARFAHAASLDPCVREDAGDRAPGDAVLLGEAELAGTREVLADDLLFRENAELPRWDAPGDPFSMETRDGYTSRGRDLLQRLARQVELDRVVEVRRVQWSGHVYSLTSSEGWHDANSLIVSNCDCIHVPSKNVDTMRGEGLLADPYEYFRSLSPEEQAKIFGKSEARAIRDGADVFQVVNARRGMSKVGTRPASRARTTTEGTTRRGNFGRTTGKGTRLTVDEIYRTAGTRTRALRMLEEYGYVLPGGQNPHGSLVGQREGFGALARGGTRRAATEAVLEARRTGRRDPTSRYTMTEAERRTHDAARDWEMVQKGFNPYQAGASQRYAALMTGRPAPRGGSTPRPLTDDDRARAERAYRKFVLGLDGGDPAVRR